MSISVRMRNIQLKVYWISNFTICDHTPLFTVVVISV